MIRAQSAVEALSPYLLADPGPPGALSLAQNESAFPPSPHALVAAQSALTTQSLYPDPDWSDLRKAISEVLGLDPLKILCGAGSMELIGCLVKAFAGPGEEVLGSAYGYLFVKTAAAQAGARYRSAPESNFTVSPEALLEAVMPHTRVLFLCNPGNPTGTRIANSEIVRLRERLSPNVLLVVDQAYGEFDGQDPSPIFDLVGRGDTVVLRTFSKAYGLAGARVGWGLFPEEIAASVRKLLNPNNVSSCSQAMAAAALRDQDHMLGLVRKTEIIRDEALRRLRGAGYPVPQSHTNFLLVPFETPERAAEADELLRREGFILRGMGGYGLPRCLRATVVEEVAMRRVADIICALQEGGNAK